MPIETNIKPRWCETDANGHITNTVPPIWFEEGRAAFYEAADLPPAFVVVRLTVEYLAELRFGHPVRVVTELGAMGNKSVTLLQQLWQKGHLCGRAQVIQCCWERSTRVSRPIPDEIRIKLAPYLRAQQADVTLD